MPVETKFRFKNVAACLLSAYEKDKAGAAALTPADSTIWSLSAQLNRKIVRSVFAAKSKDG